MRVLVRTPNWIGDQVLAYPFFKRLRTQLAARHPKVEIHVACVPWVKDLQFRDLVDQVHVLPGPARSTWDRFKNTFAPYWAARAICGLGGPFDLGISLPNSWSTGIFLAGSGAKRRRGYATEARSLFLTEALPWDPDPKRHRAQAYLDLLDEASNVAAFRDVETFDPAKSWPDSAISSLPPVRDPFWIIAPGATAPARQWHWTRFAEVIGAAFREYSWTPILVGGPKEVEVARKLEGWCAEKKIPAFSLVQQVPVTHLWPLFRRAKLTLCNESGLAHVAALCGSPVHIACGAADPRRTAPFGPGHVTVSTNPVPCWPCEENHCPNSGEKYLACLKGLGWERVWSELRSRHAIS